MNKKQLYYLISSILSLDQKPDNAHEVIKRLPQNKEDWQKWVQLGSKHLVLQSLFLSLKRHQLLSYFPDDLTEYLNYIHQLNIERNQSITEQAKSLQYLFDKEGIVCIFMKGTGNIFDGLYHDIGERMVYDMDILVEEDKMLKAAQALLDVGYKTQKNFNPLAYPSTMHYPILLREDCVAGVEIHRLPVQYQYLKSFPPERVFETKKPSTVQTGFWVMSDSNKIIHNFLHSQLMHNAHYHADVSLRDLYDILLMSKRKDIVRVFKDFKRYQKESNAYIQLMYKVFGLPIPNSLRKTYCNAFFFTRHNMTLAMNRKQLMIYHLVISAFIKYIALPFRTIFDKNARNYVFSRLKNKHWYKEHMNAYKRKYFGKRKVK